MQDKRTSSYILQSVELSDGTVFLYATKKSLKNIIGLDSPDGYVVKFSDLSRLTSGITNARTIEVMSPSVTMTIEGNVDTAQFWNSKFYPKLQALGSNGYIDFEVKDHIRNKISIIRMTEPQCNDGNAISISEGDIDVTFTGLYLNMVS